MILIGGVVVYPLVCVAAGRVKRYFVFSAANVNTASLLVNRTENVEKLTYTFSFAAARYRVHLRESNLCKS